MDLHLHHIKWKVGVIPGLVVKVPTKKIPSSFPALPVCLCWDQGGQPTSRTHTPRVLSEINYPASWFPEDRRLVTKRDKSVSLENLSRGIWIYLFMSRCQLPVKKTLRYKEVVRLEVWYQNAVTFKEELSLCCLFTFDYLSYPFHQLKPILKLLFEPQKEKESHSWEVPCNWAALREKQNTKARTTIKPLQL